MISEVKAVVFDAYGTLLDINSLDGILSEHFGTKSVQLSISWRRKQLEYTWLRTLMDKYLNFSQVTMDALKHSCKAHQLELSEDLLQKLHTGYLKLVAYPEVTKILQTLSSKLMIGVLSNANHQMLQGAIERNGWQDLFDHVLSAEDVGLFKPSPEVYQMACIKFALRPEQILFVSSNTWDVSGAKSFGLTVAWLNRFGGVTEELGVKPDFVLNKMEELFGVMNYEL